MTFESTLELPQAGVPFSLPLAQPDPSARPAPAATRTPEQDAALNKLIAHFNAPEFGLPSTIDALKANVWRKRDGSSGRGLFGWGSAPKEVAVEELKPLDEVEKCYWSSQVRFEFYPLMKKMAGFCGSCSLTPPTVRLHRLSSDAYERSSGTMPPPSSVQRLRWSGVVNLV